MPSIVAGIEDSSVRLSIGTITVFAPFSDSRDTRSEKLLALSIAPPIDILPSTQSAALSVRPNRAEMMAVNTAAPMPRLTVDPSIAVTCTVISRLDNVLLEAMS